MIEPRTVKIDAAELLALIRRRLQREFDKGEAIAAREGTSQSVAYAAGMVAGLQAARNIVRSLSVNTSQRNREARSQ